MWKLSPAVMALVCLVPDIAQALELKNVRPTYGPNGAVRAGSKYLAGDIVYLTYDIEGIKINSKTLKGALETIIEMKDGRNKTIYKKALDPVDILVPLGGDRVQQDMHITIGPNQAAGDYKINLTVKDRISKESKTHVYAFEVSPPEFGFKWVQGWSFGWPGEIYGIKIHLANYALDSKKMPKAEVTLKILDENGKVMGTPQVQVLPRDLAPPPESNVAEGIVPILFVFNLNRPGRFTLSIEAEDKIAQRQAQLRLPLTVLDLGQLSK
jgi:hypothetical protein